jgi:hypothetical protein
LVSSTSPQTEGCGTVAGDHGWPNYLELIVAEDVGGVPKCMGLMGVERVQKMPFDNLIIMFFQVGELLYHKY